MEINSSKEIILKSSARPNATSNKQSVNSSDQNTKHFKGYSNLVPIKNDLRNDPFGCHLEVRGKIYDYNNSAPLSGIFVDIWHLSPKTKHFGHRARFYTDDTGSYYFLTDFPGRELGKNYKIYFKRISKAT